MILKEPVNSVRGIGPKKTKLLAKLGIYSLEDALYYLPRDYEIYPQVTHIASIKDGERVSLCVEFKGKPDITRKNRGLSILKWKAIDDTGSVICLWFNQLYRISQYKSGVPYYIYGKVSKNYGQVQIQNPNVEEYKPEIHQDSRIEPIYSLVEGLTQKDLKNLSNYVIGQIDENMEDPLPELIREKYNLADIGYALKNIHYPKNHQSHDKSRRRLIFEELFFLQLALYAIRENLKTEKRGIVFEWDNKITDGFFRDLSFSLTNAQKRVTKEIFRDFKKGIPMNRLIYGDVGSGKTLIAAVALLICSLAGYQGVLMAPTEILARQHFKTLKELLKNNNIKISLLIGGIPDKEKERIKNDIAQDKTQIVVATHAVLQDDVNFCNLGLAVTDEQHRFGVKQRAAIAEKARNVPHVMVMSATPIPRTLALIFYGDLDISLIDEMPPGRKPIKTYHVPSSMRERIYAFIRKQVNLGHQTYLVCPLVEESDKIHGESAVEMLKTLKNGPLSNLRLGLIHGRMKAEEKEDTMINFQNGKIDVLISTTVIEVGVNIARANLMVIENADRFGLAALHQLRGRVGRSHSQSYCILIADTKSENAKERMNVLVKTNDGFEISQKDLELRGPGEFSGTRQHGLPEFKIADPARDMDVLKEAQEAANEIIGLEDNEHRENLLIRAHTKFYKNIEKTALN